MARIVLGIVLKAKEVGHYMWWWMGRVWDESNEYDIFEYCLEMKYSVLNKDNVPLGQHNIRNRLRYVFGGAYFLLTYI